ncbi:hypothetical protein CC1G_14144 [Coprinopsis cinerea okayama7|uniref:Uncharacterized protein n=1 Tax=Coprinopsis cinerea (strain Okayama-7 / 130 / ATCC MYA-4618 / FGSC 9003) TaxID=240176 RepID=D6RLK5_COPC7|nr:hypothetical protein CC1G_14144 [Coprinopsis cinerea okayama7\|eukprot:XP_002911611.1 hypothetical protein CC1G_14144 [Coprinopsis cinerea okayama7\
MIDTFIASRSEFLCHWTSPVQVGGTKCSVLCGGGDHLLQELSLVHDTALSVDVTELARDVCRACSHREPIQIKRVHTAFKFWILTPISFVPVRNHGSNGDNAPSRATGANDATGILLLVADLVKSPALDRNVLRDCLIPLIPVSQLASWSDVREVRETRLNRKQGLHQRIASGGRLEIPTGVVRMVESQQRMQIWRPRHILQSREEI